MTEDPPLLAQLAEFTVQAHRTLPAEVDSSVAQRSLDILGICLAAKNLDSSEAAISFVRDQGGTPQATAIGLGATNACWAAFVNGVLAHSLDYDDTHLPSVLHPSASVVPAAFAVAEQHGVPGRRVVAAIASGLEICVRLGMAGFDRDANESVFLEHGQHATSICGAIGAAAAAASLIGPTPDPYLIVHAMGIAVSMASGLIEGNRAGGTVKRIHCGWAAHAGVTAAQLAGHGITGPPTALEGRFGFFEGFLHGRSDLAEVTRGLGQEWAVPGIFFKPYPANHFTHTIVDAAARLRSQGLRPDQVATAHVGTSTAVVRTIGEPIAIKREPETGYQAQFSAPFAFTVGLLGGGGLGAALSDYTDAKAHEPLRRSLMARTTVGPDPRCDASFPYQFPSVLTVRTTDGRVLEEAVWVNRGGPENPLSGAELGRKFRDNAGVALAGPDLEEVIRRVLDLGRESDFAGLMRLLEPSAALVRARG